MAQRDEVAEYLEILPANSPPRSRRFDAVAANLPAGLRDCRDFHDTALLGAIRAARGIRSRAPIQP
jgi:hypothetical protein